MTNNWKLEGQYFESHTSDLVCPCIFLRPPTQGFCKAMVGWQIEKGYIGDVDLSDFNVVLWLYAPGFMIEGIWYLLAYITLTKQVRATYMLQRLSKKNIGSISCLLLCYENGNF